MWQAVQRNLSTTYILSTVYQMYLENLHLIINLENINNMVQSVWQCIFSFIFSHTHSCIHRHIPAFLQKYIHTYSMEQTNERINEIFFSFYIHFSISFLHLCICFFQTWKMNSIWILYCTVAYPKSRKGDKTVIGMCHSVLQVLWERIAT